MIGEFLRHAAPSLLFGLALQFLAILVAFGGIVGLRFFRRGAARFAMSPAMAGLALAPTAFGIGIAVLGLRHTFEGIALTGSGGLAALAAGSSESLVALAFGLTCTAGLAFLALLATAAGSSRAPADTPGRGIALPLVTLLVAALTAGLVLFVTAAVVAPNAGVLDPGALVWTLRLGYIGAGALVVFLMGWVVATSVRVPRGAVSLGVKLVSLFALLGIAAGSLLAAVAVFGQMGALSTAALTGEPYEGAFGSFVRNVAGRAGATVETPPVVVVVDDEGYKIAGQRVPAPELPARLAAVRKGADRLVLGAEYDRRYTRLAPVVDAAAQAGWTFLQLRRSGQVVVRLPHRLSEPAQGPALITVRVGEGDLEINKTALRDRDHLETLLRDVLSQRVSKLVVVWPRDDVSFEVLADTLQAMLAAGAEPVLVTAESMSTVLLLPPPPPMR